MYLTHNFWFSSLGAINVPLFNKNPFSWRTQSRPAQLYNCGGRSASWAVFWCKELDISFAVTENKDRGREGKRWWFYFVSSDLCCVRIRSLLLYHSATPCARGWTMWVQSKTSNKNKTWWVYQNRQASQSRVCSQSSVWLLTPEWFHFFLQSYTLDWPFRFWFSFVWEWGYSSPQSFYFGPNARNQLRGLSFTKMLQIWSSVKFQTPFFKSFEFERQKHQKLPFSLSHNFFSVFKSNIISASIFVANYFIISLLYS
jgi:hypothetical protein